MSENTHDRASVPTFTGTPDMWWEAAEQITEHQAAERDHGDWYIARETHTKQQVPSYRISTPALGSNHGRLSTLARETKRGAVDPEAVSNRVRRLIRTPVTTPVWANADLVIADIDHVATRREPWRRSGARWKLLSNNSITVGEQDMALLRPKVAEITEVGD